MTGGLQQFDRVLKSTFRPAVSDEAWQSMDEANPFDQQEWLEWKAEQEETQ